MSFRPHAFGRYTILDPIAVGGMAEIYRARLTNTGDAPDRILIIKKIISALSSNNDFVEMFEGEIKITVGLSHPNIVQIYDYGRVDGVSFLAMEYVEGKNLRQFLKRLISMKSMFSIDMSCYIVSQVCNALAYAHAFKDRMTGEHLGIVHRDVSPQNVMISYDGAVKLFDFGIAKAKSASEATQAGVIKGKPSYLSPEQISGEVLDGRSDIFSLGIVLWEMLTAKRLFVADNDMAILRMIQSAKIESPSTYNPAIPQALDAIVLRGLARDRDKRYKTAEEMQRDLHRFLYSFNPGFNPADLSYYATELFKKEISEDRDRLRAALKLQPDPNPLSVKRADGKQDTHATTPSAQTNDKANRITKTEGLLSSTDFNREVMEDMLMTKTSHTEDPDTDIELQQGQKEQVANPSAKDVKGQKPVLPVTGQTKASPRNSTKSVTKAAPTQASRIAKVPSKTDTRAGKNAKGEDLVIPPWVNQERSGGSKKINATSFNDGLVDRRSRARPGSRSIQIDREIEFQARPKNKGPILGGLLAAIVVILLVGVKVFPNSFSPVLGDGPLAFLLPSRTIASVPKKEDSTEAPKPPKHKNTKIDSSPSIEPDTEIVKKPEKTPEVAPKEDVYVPITLDSNESNVDVTVNRRPVAVDGNVFKVLMGIDLNIEVTKPGFDPKIVQMKLTSAEPRSIKVVLEKIEKGYLTFYTNPGADITLRSNNRKAISTFTPLKKFELPAGDYEAVIENSRINHKSTLKFKVEKGKLTTIEKDL